MSIAGLAIIARAISSSLLRSVRGLGSSSRAACIVSVEPPETTRPARAHCPAARSIASGSTPGCHQKRLSSAAMKALRTTAGICS